MGNYAYTKFKRISDTITINGVGTANSSSLETTPCKSFGIFYKSTSVAGTPNIKLQLEVSKDDITYEIPVAWPDIVSWSDEVEHMIVLDVPPVPYIRIKSTGNAGNPTDSILDIWIFGTD